MLEFDSNKSHPEQDGSMPLGVMESLLGEQYRSLETELDATLCVIQDEAINLVEQRVVAGDDWLAWKLTDNEHHFEGDITDESSENQAFLDRYKQMSDFEQTAIKKFCSWYVLYVMDLPTGVE